jgi:molybdopterin molybdotransferase
MISFQQALQKIRKEAQPCSTEKVKLRNALHRTLGEDIVAKENIPPFDNSAMDGFALRSNDVRNATKKNVVRLKVVGESSAGSPFDERIGQNESVRIMTGAKIPAGADAVVPIESVEVLDDDTIQVNAPVKAGAHVRRAGEDVRKKETVLRKGEFLAPARIGLLASLGYSKVSVARKPRVHILATGDELVQIDDKLNEGQIRNSNSYTLASYVEQTGGEPEVLGIAPDKKKKLRKAVGKALDCDILLITGGVSVGKYDVVKDILERVGVKIEFWRVNIKPGKPLVFGTFGKTLVFGMPGNPVSTSVAFLQFVRPAMRKMLGDVGTTDLQISAILDEPISKHDGKQHFVRGIAASRNGQMHVRTTGTQSSGALSSVAKANCLIIMPEKTMSLKKGSRVLIELLSYLEP